MIRKTAPNVLGVSRPRGMAVTSGRPVLRQTKGHERVNKVAHQHANGGPWNHASEHELLGNLKNADQQTGHEDHTADVVEHQSEESIDITLACPDIAGLGGVAVVDRHGIHDVWAP